VCVVTDKDPPMVVATVVAAEEGGRSEENEILNLFSNLISMNLFRPTTFRVSSLSHFCSLKQQGP
jgi:hypothetical protein